MGLTKTLILKTLGLPLGESLLHAQFPDDVELYMTALEVRDEDDELNPIKDFMIFPINPDSAMVIEKTFANVNKSLLGSHILDNDSFVPKPINLSGTFGVNMKTVFAGKPTIKTGYGLTKYLQKLINLGKTKNSSGKPYRMILYLFPFGQVFTIIVNECRFTQSLESNRMWRYDLNVTAVAPGDINSSINYGRRLKELFVADALQKITNKIFQKGKKLL